jgi:serine/threonine protein kinase
MQHTGGYGIVRDQIGGWVIKTTEVYDVKSTIIGSNITEAALGVTVCQGMPHVIGFRGARIIGETIEVTMKRGERTLHEYVRDTRFAVRMGKLRHILRCLLIGLRALHTRQLAHCDLKPANIIMCGDDATIIDLGSVRFVMRANHTGEQTDVICTYIFCAPESLLPDARPTFEHDAYSLGAILHLCIFKTYFAKGLLSATTCEEALEMYEKERPVVPTDRPRGADPRVFEAMRGLLNPDPAKRTRLDDLYAEFVEPTTPVPREELILDFQRSNVHDPDRDTDIDILSDICLTPGSFPLAVSIRDRSGAKGMAEMMACAMLAHMTLYPGAVSPRVMRTVKRAIDKIIRRLDFELYSDTAEWVLWLKYGVAKTDPDVLRQAIKDGGGDTLLAVRLYLDETVSSSQV